MPGGARPPAAWKTRILPRLAATLAPCSTALESTSAASRARSEPVMTYKSSRNAARDSLASFRWLRRGNRAAPAKTRPVGAGHPARRVRLGKYCAHCHIAFRIPPESAATRVHRSDNGKAAGAIWWTFVITCQKGRATCAVVGRIPAATVKGDDCGLRVELDSCEELPSCRFQHASARPTSTAAWRHRMCPQKPVRAPWRPNAGTRPL